MSEYKAIALDMDGTLLTRDHKISSATRAALAQARAHGIKVLLVTGRHYMTARPFHHELALDTPLICSNGAYLYDPVQNRILSGDPLATAPLTELLAAIEAQQMGALFHLSEGIGYLGCEEHVTRIRHWSANQPDYLKIAIHPVEELTDWLDKPVWKLELFNQDPARLHTFMGEVVEQMPFTRDWAQRRDCAGAGGGVWGQQQRHQHVRAGGTGGGHGQCGRANQKSCPSGHGRPQRRWHRTGVAALGTALI